MNIIIEIVISIRKGLKLSASKIEQYSMTKYDFFILYTKQYTLIQNKTGWILNTDIIIFNKPMIQFSLEFRKYRIQLYQSINW